MSATVQYSQNKASASEIDAHLAYCSANFVPHLDERVDIPQYAKKISDAAERFEAWVDGRLVGLVAVYCNNDEKKFAFMTSVSVSAEWTGFGISGKLIGASVAYAKKTGMERVRLEVASENLVAIELYRKNGFVANAKTNSLIFMELILKRGAEDE